MKPIININDVNDFQEHKHESFEAKYANISQKIGAEKLGYNITIVPPGKKSWPFHNHHVSEEMFKMELKHLKKKQTPLIS